MSIIIQDYGNKGTEESADPDFLALPLDRQLHVLRHEMWEWATGRSYYSPSTTGAGLGSRIEQQQSYLNSMIVRKAIQIEVLLKLLDAERAA